jgi:hypothetical protein
MAERNGLFGPDAFARDPRGALQLVRSQTQCAQCDYQENNTGARVMVGTRWKELRHLTVFPVPTEISQYRVK